MNLSKYAPEFKIYIDGEAKEDLRRAITSVQISEQTGNPSEFTFAVADTVNPKTQEFVWFDSPLLDIGRKVKIEIGYSTRLVEIIVGEIKSLSTSGFSGDVPKVTVVGYDLSHRHLTEQSTGPDSIQIDRNDTYSTIAKKIAGKAKLKDDVDDTTLYSPITIKKNVTYYDFLKDAAKRVGFEVFVSRDTLHFSNPRKPKETTLDLRWGKNIIQFTPSINTADLVTEVEVRGHLPDSKNNTSQVARSGSEDTLEEGKTTASELAVNSGIGKKETIEDSVIDTEQEAADLAKARLNIISDNLVTGSASIVGTPELSPGTIISIDGVGKRFSGKYYVASVTHTIDANGYTTAFNVRKNVI